MEPIFEIRKAEYYISVNVFTAFQTPLRRVNEYEIELYTTSDNTSVINGTPYRQAAGNVLVAKPGDLRYSQGSFECHCVHFLCHDAELCEQLNKLPPLSHAHDAEALERLFRSLPEAWRSARLSGMLASQGALMQLIGLLVGEDNEVYSGRYLRYEPNIAAACEYIKKRLDCTVSLTDMAMQAHLSPGFFHTVFKDIKGTTPAGYLTEQRVRRAKELLRKSNLPLVEIAIRCGFGSQGYFGYVFKKQTGQTPKTYRDKKQIII